MKIAVHFPDLAHWKGQVKCQAGCPVATDAGREFVEAYVEFTHYVERLHLDAATSAAHGAGAPAAEHKH